MRNLLLGVGFVCILTLVYRDFAQSQEAPDAMISIENTGLENTLQALMVKSPRCEYRVDPGAIDESAPRLSWTLESSSRAQRQSAYRILVADSLAGLEAGEGNLWDSGKVASSRTSPIVYEGKPLGSRMQCFWKVQVWDGEDRASAWSEPARWTMGLMNDSDWQAEWIGAEHAAPDVSRQEDLSRSKWIWFPEGNPADKAPVATRYFRRAFQLPAIGPVQSASCRISADNNFTLFVNGTSVGQGADFTSVTEIDLAPHLRPGQNVLAVEAGNAGERENPAGLIASLRIEWAEGNPLTIVTDAKWKAFQEKIEYWAQPDFSDDAWPGAKELGDYGCAPWSYLSSSGLYLPPVKYLRKAFTLSRPVKRATLYATALGLYEAQIDGQKVGQDFLTPGWTDYRKRVYYNTYDVTALMKPGERVLGVLLSDGWYSGYVGWGRKRDHDGERPWFRAQLEVEYADGSKETIPTDRTWKVSTGSLREADLLMGETCDARLEPQGWNAPGFADAAWQPVDATSFVSASIEAYPGVPVQVWNEIAPVTRTEPAPGHYVFDFGTNFAGFARLKVKGKAGDRIVLRFAERLNPDGTIYTVNLRGARATDAYICRGGGEEVWQPRFTFHGFQYVEVTGYPGVPAMDALTGIEIGSQTPVAGSFECSDSMANRLYRNICQTQRANFLEIPTDCPQRDERLGWTGDAQIYIRTASYNNDVAAFFAKWLVDLDDGQFPDGGFPDIAPRKTHHGYGVAAWGDAGVICPWTAYEVYGDKRFLERHYPAMTGWIGYCREHSEGGLRPAAGYGDWLSIQADTPKDVLATAYYAHSTDRVARAAEVLGKSEDAAAYRKQFEEIRAAFNKAYVGEDGRIQGDTQTVYVLALAFDLLPPEKRARAAAYLVENIEARDGHLSTGFVGTKDLMTVLTKIGRTDVAYRLFHNKTFPSWGFSIEHGATSIWERWDGWTPEKGFQDPGMNSFAHYSFGAVGEWMFKTIGGIDMETPGFEKVIIRPIPGGNLNHANVAYHSIRGPIATRWEKDSGRFRLQVALPANTSATVYIPARDADAVSEGGVPASEAEAVRFLRMEDGAAVYEIGSGAYAFASELPTSR